MNHLGLGAAHIKLEFDSNDSLARYLRQHRPEEFRRHKARTHFDRVERQEDEEEQDLAPMVSIDAPRHRQTWPAPPNPAVPDHEPDLPMLPAASVFPEGNADLDEATRLIALSDIHAATDLFQNRETEYSQSSVENILAAVEQGTFDWAAFDAVTLWRKPEDGRLYILSGHSRTEAFRQLAARGIIYQGRSFERIPAKVFEGDFETAQRIALTSNSLATKETDLERAAYYRRKRAAGASFKDLEAEASRLEGKNKNVVLALSYLNPAGRAWQSIELFNAENQSLAQVRSIAQWCGIARRLYPELTDSHENEIYEWLTLTYGKSITAQPDFLSRLDSVVNRMRLQGDGVLNPLNRSVRSSAMLEYQRELDESRRALDRAKAELQKRRKDAIDNRQDVQQAIAEYDRAVSYWTKKVLELEGRKSQYKEAERSQMSLFGLGGLNGAHLGLGNLPLYHWPRCNPGGKFGLGCGAIQGVHLGLSGRPQKGYSWRRGMSCNEVMRMLEANGWKYTEGAEHRKYFKNGCMVTVERHGKKQIAIGTLANIRRTVELAERNSPS